MTIGERIKQKRLELGLSQEELAHRMGNKSRASICTVENDKEDLTTTRIRKFAEALNTTPGYLMGWEDDGIPTVVKKVPDKTIRIDLDNGISIIYDPSKENDVKTAIELYQKFQKTNPDVQSAIELLLKPAKSDT